MQDGHAVFERGRIDLDDHAGDETVDQRFREVADQLGMGVGSHDHLLAGRIDGIEGVQKLLLRGLLVGEEMDVIDQEHINASKAVPKRIAVVALDCIDEMIGKFFAGDINAIELGVLLFDSIIDRLQQVRLAEAAPAVDEQRVVLGRGVLDHADRTSLGESIARADDEILNASTQRFLGLHRSALAMFPRLTLRIVGHEVNLRVQLSLLQIFGECRVNRETQTGFLARDFRDGLEDHV